MSDLTSGLLQETTQYSFRIPVFLSYATPFNERQTKFLERIIKERSPERRRFWRNIGARRRSIVYTGF